jgi:hypothetical protein
MEYDEDAWACTGFLNLICTVGQFRRATRLLYSSHESPRTMPGRAAFHVSEIRGLRGYERELVAWSIGLVDLATAFADAIGMRKHGWFGERSSTCDEFSAHRRYAAG